MVERWFRDITDKRVRSETFQRVDELFRIIEDYISHNNDCAKPFVWNATAEEIMATVARARKDLDNLPSA